MSEKFTSNRFAFGGDISGVTNMDLSAHADPIEVTSDVPYMDPDWTEVDTSGHIVTPANVSWLVDRMEWCSSCDDYHEEGHYECPLCGEEVEPKTKTDTFRKFVPGSVEVTLTFEGSDVPKGASYSGRYGEVAGTWVLESWRSIAGPSSYEQSVYYFRP